MKCEVWQFIRIDTVAPHAGAWIEIVTPNPATDIATSPLTQGRGLKYITADNISFFHVAPHAGAWIEIPLLLSVCLGIVVAPHAGAWIEI